MVNFQDLFRSPYRCVSAPFSPLCPNNAALVRISSVLVEISSVLVRISSELVEISSELVCKIFELFLRISELLKISTFRKNRKRRTTARSFVRSPPNRPIRLFCVYCPTMTNFKTAAHASQHCFAMANVGDIRVQVVKVIWNGSALGLHRYGHSTNNCGTILPFKCKKRFPNNSFTSKRL